MLFLNYDKILIEKPARLTRILTRKRQLSGMPYAG